MDRKSFQTRGAGGPHALLGDAGALTAKPADWPGGAVLFVSFPGALSGARREAPALHAR